MPSPFRVRLNRVFDVLHKTAVVAIVGTTIFLVVSISSQVVSRLMLSPEEKQARIDRVKKEHILLIL